MDFATLQNSRAASTRISLLMAIFALLVFSPQPSWGQYQFIRGDLNGDSVVSLTDPLSALQYMFLGQGVPCLDAVDANDNGNTGIDDAIVLLNYLFLGGIPPSPPFPSCGYDPSGDFLDCSEFVGCAAARGEAWFPGIEMLVGDSPFATELIDLDGDGDLDLVTAHRFGGDIGVSLGRGNGIFEAQVAIPAAGGFGLASADFNGDGVPDLVSVGSMASVLIGIGDGTFAAAANYPVGANAFAVAVGDVDGDTIVDVVVANSFGDDATLLLGNGDGTFRGGPALPLGDEPRSVALGDVDSDGDLDLAVALFAASTGLGELLLLDGSGDGTFVERERLMFATEGPRSVTLGDLDSDGDLDLLTSNYTSSVRRYDNDGDGNFSELVLFPVVQGVFTRIVDMNDDGVQDVVVAEQALDKVSVVLFDDFGGATVHSYLSSLDPRSLAVGDVNADGALDIAASNADSDDVSLFLGIGDGTMFVPLEFPVDSAPAALVLGEFDDLAGIDVIASSPSTGRLSLISGVNSAQPLPNEPIATPVAPRALATGDLNGDSVIDIVAASELTDSVLVLIASAGAGFSQTTYGVGDSPLSLQLADFDGDMNPDIVTANRFDATVSVLRGSGDGTFAARQDFSVGAGPYSVTTGDVNGDGFVDIVTAHFGSADLGVLRGLGDGSFEPVQLLATLQPPTSVLAVDLDDDGNLDIAYVSAPSNSVGVLLGGGLGVFGQETSYAVGDTPVQLAAFDLDLDGDLELVTANGLGASITVLYSDGRGGFPLARSFPVGSGPTGLQFTDIDGDGDIDIACSVGSTHSVTVLPNFLNP